MLRLSDEIIQESTFYQLIREKCLEEGLEQGLHQGLEQGRIEEGRNAVRAVLEVRFPGLAALSLEKITDVTRLEQLIRKIVAAPDVEAARAAIDSALGD
jgi:predicted transposase YdaD